MQITSRYGLSDGSLTSDLDIVLNGFRVWLLAEQMQSLVIEILDRQDQLLRKWELPINYDTTDDDERYDTHLKPLEEFLRADRVEGAAAYRIIVLHRTENPVAVPGWKPAQLKDDGHLTRRLLSELVIGTKHLGASAYVLVNPPSSKLGEPS
jgi:hypothetical protein